MRRRLRQAYYSTLTRGRLRSLTDGRPAGFGTGTMARGDSSKCPTWTNSASARLQRGPCTAALLAWEAGVEEVQHEKPILDVHRAKDFLCFGHWATYVVFKNANDTWSPAQQIAWAYAMTAGAADITTVQEFFEHAHTLEAITKFPRRRARG